MLFNYEIQATLINGQAALYGNVEADTISDALTQALSRTSDTASWDEWPRGTNADVTVWSKEQPRKATERSARFMVR